MRGTFSVCALLSFHLVCGCEETEIVQAFWEQDASWREVMVLEVHPNSGRCGIFKVTWKHNRDFCSDVFWADVDHDSFAANKANTVNVERCYLPREKLRGGTCTMPCEAVGALEKEDPEPEPAGDDRGATLLLIMGIVACAILAGCCMWCCCTPMQEEEDEEAPREVATPPSLKSPKNLGAWASFKSVQSFNSVKDKAQGARRKLRRKLSIPAQGTSRPRRSRASPSEALASAQAKAVASQARQGNANATNMSQTSPPGYHVKTSPFEDSQRQRESIHEPSSPTLLDPPLHYGYKLAEDAPFKTKDGQRRVSSKENVASLSPRPSPRHLPQAPHKESTRPVNVQPPRTSPLGPSAKRRRSD